MLTPCEGIQEFLMVVEAGSFTAAASRSGASVSHISRQVARLEDRLGVRLLVRSTRSLKLSDAGADYHRSVADLFAGIEEANQMATGTAAQLSGRIRVSTAGIFAEEMVAPALAQFAKDHPQISIEMDFSPTNVDLVDQGFDFAVRYGALTDNSLTARKITRRTMICAASPDYLAEHGTPLHPGELRGHDCLRTHQSKWTFTDPETGTFFDIAPNGRWIANNGQALRHAAVKGLGIAYAPQVNLHSALDDGSIVRILEGYEDQNQSSWIVYPEKRLMPLRVRRAIDYILSTLG